MPDERTRILLDTWAFLVQLTHPQGIPQVPVPIREIAMKLLLRFPMPSEVLNEWQSKNK